ncbi:MAG: NUDIX domain-containing protein [Sedimentibacter sp.]|uniref:NUDIX domain-containing protein n=1 Tax=Sedimentibacter sp. TaxID=1960295 RepID=UPI0029829C9D|nr:NUDIX domain-containing protein [Sedimentibacter sp.]MDW5299378.1 NUDIX domain-containing protein [Sedimentibacter sp.]
MLVFRNVATAFLMNGNDFLLMERAKENDLMPSFWYGVGGHLEQDELNNPRAACLREIYEETGLTENSIENLQLKYVLLRRSKNETVINYVYFGHSKTRDVVENDEGTLHWIAKEEVLKYRFIDALKLALKHYFENSNSLDEVLVGVVRSDNSSSSMSWGVLQNMDGTTVLTL